MPNQPTQSQADTMLARLLVLAKPVRAYQAQCQLSKKRLVAFAHQLFPTHTFRTSSPNARYDNSAEWLVAEFVVPTLAEAGLLVHAPFPGSPTNYELAPGLTVQEACAALSTLVRMGTQ